LSFHVFHNSIIHSCIYPLVDIIEEYGQFLLLFDFVLNGRICPYDMDFFSAKVNRG